MVLDPLTALGLASNLISLIEFSGKLLSKSHAIYTSANGALPENIEIEKTAEALRTLNAKIKFEILKDGRTKSEDALRKLCEDCDGVAGELLRALEKLKVGGRKTRWKSFRQALKSVMGKGEIEGISKRLDNCRAQLSLSFLVELSGRVDLAVTANAESFETLEANTRDIITAILKQSSELNSVFATQIQEIEVLHTKGQLAQKSQHDAVVGIITNVSESSKIHVTEEHIRTREEVIKLKEEAATLKRDMEKEFAELKKLIRATAEAKGGKEQNTLKQKATAVSASWFAKDIMYSNLMSTVSHTKLDKGKEIIDSNSIPTPAPEPGPPGSLRYHEISHNLKHVHIPTEEEYTRFMEPRENQTMQILEKWKRYDDRFLRKFTSGEKSGLDEESKIQLSSNEEDAPVESDSTPEAPEKTHKFRREPMISHRDEGLRLKNVPYVWEETEQARELTSMEKLLKDMNFREKLEELPKSMQIALSQRFNKWTVKDLTSSRHRPFFFIGTFIFPAGIWCRTDPKLVSLKQVARSMTPGTLRGYARHAVRQQDWPALYPAQSVYTEAKGMVLFGLSEYHHRIHEFQGGMYDLKKETVEIELADGSPMQIEVDIYVWNGDVYNLYPLREKSWSPSVLLKSDFYQPLAAIADAEERLIEESCGKIASKEKDASAREKLEAMLLTKQKAVDGSWSVADMTRRTERGEETVDSPPQQNSAQPEGHTPKE
ncbi:hypothetical protein B0J14DRAFT_650537 [Halenospora varia]|nr:hypothetical protein B0J14DRAFT_650537 [Halenospora varia]